KAGLGHRVASWQLSINAIVRVGLCYGFELGRRRYIESLLSPLSRRGRKPAINNVVHYLVGILLVDIRDLLAFLVCHGDRGITRAFELGARSGALAAKSHESKEPQLVTLVLPMRIAIFVFNGREFLGKAIRPCVKLAHARPRRNVGAINRDE